ncbi:cellulase family glycosylhydrolase [Lachnospira multipara]|uniref:cellulase family glycosylhydrolase n=1 Tax=Lachnospira multipara TaxID=28051 RepID=UPI000683F972|nr:cellulase family glycosylhydrolase [Lachnospira multipara]
MKRAIRILISFALVLVLVIVSMNYFFINIKADEQVYLSISKSNSWESEGKYYAQFNVTITNNSSKNLQDWTINISKSGGEISQSWCCFVSDLGNSYELKPESYNKEIKAGENQSNVGLIMSFPTETSNINASISSVFETEVMESPNIKEEDTNKEIKEDLANAALVASRCFLSYADAPVIAIRACYDYMIVLNTESKQEQETIAEAAITAAQTASEFATDGDVEPINTANNDNNAYEVGKDNEPVIEDTNPEAVEDTQPVTSVTGNKNIPTGRLRVSGTKLVDASGNVVQLRGVSSHGLSWFPEYVNESAMASLKADFGINVFRIAMYPREYAGYLTGGDKETLKAKIDEGVRAAANQGLYVIIDWHVLNYNPNEIKDEAISFFNEMSMKYAGYDNVIYEICNEPVGADWASQIKPYAESVIATIRANDPNALVIVGTNTWSQDVDAVVENEINDANVCYSLHFYAATHKDNIQNKLRYAINNGVPVFVSECSICDASGNGGIDYASANSWLELLNSLDVSYIAWSLCNKAETSALINSSCSKTSGWSEEDYSDAGKWFMQAIKNQ